MSFSYTTPTGLTGVPASLSIPLTWNPSALISGGPSLLLHFDGPNGSTSFPDSSANANVVTATGAAALTTTNPKFGTASLGGFAANSYASTPIATNGPLDLGTSDFTVELWMFPAATNPSLDQCLINTENAGSGFLLNDSAGNILSAGFGPGGAANFAHATPLTVAAWNAVAFVRNGNNFALFINGVSSVVFSAFSGTLSPAGSVLTIGYRVGSGGSVFNGQIDEVRITKGTSLYTPGVNYTPSAAPFSGVTPVGYDVYRNGVPIAQYLGTPGFTDTVPVTGIYTYNVAAWDGISSDLSALSAPFVATIGQIGAIQSKFVPALDFKAGMVANPGSINPRIYPPQEDVTVRVKT